MRAELESVGKGWSIKRDDRKIEDQPTARP